MSWFDRVPESRPEPARSALNVEKVKNKARKHEDKGNVTKAIEAYRQVLDELEGTPQIASELALFNKVGDLYLKVSQVPEAVDMYERAVGLYADQGFPNNAIALCNKILRNAPGRTHVYLKLAQLMVERGFVAEAKQNLLEYAARMQKAGKTDEAFRALKEFADLSPDNEEIRLLLAEQLKQAARNDEAREQLEKLYAESRATGDDRKSRATLDHIKAIDPEFDEETAAQTTVKAKKGAKTSELIFLDIEYDTDSAAAASAPAAPEVAPEPIEIEPTAIEPEPEPEPAAPLEVEPTALEEVVAETPEPDLVIDRASVELDASAADLETVEGLDIAPSLADEDVEVPALEIEHTSLVEEEAPAAEEPAAVVDDLPIIEPELDEVEPEEPVPAPAPEPEPVAEVEAVDAGSLMDIGGAEDLVLEPAAAEGDIEVPDLDFGAAMGDDDLLGAPTGADSLDLEPATAADRVSDAETELPEMTFDDDVTAPPDLAEAVADEADLSIDSVFDTVPEATTGPPDVAALEGAVANDPDNPQHHVALGEALIETGERERGIEELGIAVEMFQGAEDLAQASGMTDEILRLDPDNIRFQQKRVEIAYSMGDKSTLLQAYLSLADALFRTGAVDRSAAVYKRVLEHDPENARAVEALATLEPAAPEPAAPAPAPAVPDAAAAADFVDLGALILEEEPVRDTRMRIEDEEPTGDEERDFAEMLSQFKRGIEENLDDTDWQAHYDLGVAYKEMGLLDEAVAEFQKALRAPEGRLRTAEALGLCFYEKGQYSVAGTVMRRAIDADSGGDEVKIGLLYWTGRCEEEQQRVPEALVFYNRVFAVDINFQDVSDRVKQLAGSGS